MASLEAEKQQLKNDLDSVLRRGQPNEAEASQTSVFTRLTRITNLIGAQRTFFGNFNRGDERYKLPEDQGEFKLHFVREGKNITQFWYVAAHDEAFDYKDDLADVRVLMQNCADQGGVECKFVIATTDDLSSIRKGVMATFNKMKAHLPPEDRDKFVLELWDDAGLLKEERRLGLKID